MALLTAFPYMAYMECLGFNSYFSILLLAMDLRWSRNADFFFGWIYAAPVGGEWPRMVDLRCKGGHLLPQH